MIGMIRPRLSVAASVAIAMLALQSQSGLAQSVFIPSAEAAEIQQPSDAQSGVVKPATLSVQCASASEGVNCGIDSNRQQAHVTLALLYLGIRDRCMDRSCRLSVRSIGR